MNGSVVIGEDRGDGIDGEDQVHHIHHHQHQGQRREHPAARLAHQKPRAVELRGHAQPFPAEPDDGAFAGRFLLVLAEHLHAREDEEDAEAVEHPFEAGHDLHAERDHGPAHDQRADDAPEQHAVLMLRADLEEGKDHQEQEKVIDAQRVLDDVAGHEIDRAGLPFQVVNVAAEGHGQGHPDDAPEPCLPHGDGAGRAVKHEKIERQQQEHRDVKADPEWQPGMHARRGPITGIHLHCKPPLARVRTAGGENFPWDAGNPGLSSKTLWTPKSKKPSKLAKSLPKRRPPSKNSFPGSYCLHKSWGFGRIEAVNFLVNQITIDFRSKKGHTMQLQYAAESLQPIPAGHILALKATDVAAVKKHAPKKTRWG